MFAGIVETRNDGVFVRRVPVVLRHAAIVVDEVPCSPVSVVDSSRYRSRRRP